MRVGTGGCGGLDATGGARKKRQQGKILRAQLASRGEWTAEASRDIDPIQITIAHEVSGIKATSFESSVDGFSFGCAVEESVRPE